MVYLVLLGFASGLLACTGFTGGVPSFNALFYGKPY